MKVRLDLEPGGQREVIRIRYTKVDPMGRVSVGRKLAGSKILILAAKPKVPFDEIFWRWASGDLRETSAFIEQEDGTVIPNPSIKELDQVLREAGLRK